MPTVSYPWMYTGPLQPGESEFVLVDTLEGPFALSWTGPGPLVTGGQATLTPPGITLTVAGFFQSINFFPVLLDTEGNGFLLTTIAGLDTSGGFVDVFEEGEVVCFLEGTRIATPVAEVPVETLRPGDLVLSADGRALPVRFVGRQTLVSHFAPPGTRPIRIAAGALGENLPTRDLLVSPAHAIAFGDVLVQAGALVNGTSIAPLNELPESFTYFHVELAEHVLLLAEGVAAESYLDSADPARFHNSAERPPFPPLSELDMPRARSHRQVPQQIRALIAGRAVARHGAIPVAV